MNCTEQIKIHGVVFKCSGMHGPKAVKHGTAVKDSTETRIVFIDWKPMPTYPLPSNQST